MKKYLILSIFLAITAVLTTYVFYELNKAGVSYYKGKRFFNARLHAQAIPYFERAVSLRKNYYPALRDLAISSLATGKFERARECYQSMLRIKPNDRTARRGLADVLTWTGHSSESIPIYENMLRDDPADIQTMRSYADALFVSGEYARAIPLYENYLKADPTQQDALVNLAMSLMYSGQKERAWSIIAQLESRYPFSTTALKAVARFHFVNGDLDRAAAYYEKALGISDQDLDSLVQLAYIYNTRGEAQKAIDLVSRAADENPRDQMLQITVANILLWNKRFTEAETKFLEISKKWPDDPSVLTGLSHIYSWQGQMGKALPYLERAVREGADISARIELSQMYMDMKRYGEAKELLGQILGSDNNNQDAVRMLMEIRKKEKRVKR